METMSMTKSSSLSRNILCALCSLDQAEVAAHLEHLISEHFEIVSMAIHRMESVFGKSESDLPQYSDIDASNWFNSERAGELKEGRALDVTHHTQNESTFIENSVVSSDTINKGEDHPADSNVLVIEPRDELETVQDFSGGGSKKTETKIMKHLQKTPTVASKSKPIGTKPDVNQEKGGIYIVTIGNKRNIVVPGSDPKKNTTQTESTPGNTRPIVSASSPHVPLVSSARAIPSESWEYEPKSVNTTGHRNRKRTHKKDISYHGPPNKNKPQKRTPEILDSSNIKLESDQPNTESEARKQGTPFVGPTDIHIKEENEVKTLVDLKAKTPSFILTKIIEPLLQESEELVSTIQSSVDVPNWKAYLQKLNPLAETLSSIQNKIHGIETVLYKEGVHNPLKLFVLEKGQLHFQVLAHYIPVTLNSANKTLTSLVEAVAANFVDPSLAVGHLQRFTALLSGLVTDCLITHHDMFMSLIYRDHTQTEAQRVFTALLAVDPSLLQLSQVDFLLVAFSIVLQRDVHLHVLIRDPESLLPPDLTADALSEKYTEQHPALRNHVLYSAPQLLRKPVYNQHGPCRLLLKQFGRKYSALLRKSSSAVNFVPFTKPFTW